MKFADPTKLDRKSGGSGGICSSLRINPKMSERRRRGTSLRPFPNTPRVTSETVPPAQNSVPAPLSDPGADITLLKDDFGRQRILASPLSGRQVPVVSAYMRAKDSFTAVRCPTRSFSQISQPQTSRRGGIFYASPPRFAAQTSSFAIGVDRTFLLCYKNESKAISLSLFFLPRKPHLADFTRPQ